MLLFEILCKSRKSEIARFDEISFPQNYDFYFWEMKNNKIVYNTNVLYKFIQFLFWRENLIGYRICDKHKMYDILF